MKQVIAWVRRVATVIAIASFAKIALSAHQPERRPTPANNENPAPMQVPNVPSRSFLTDKNPVIVHEHPTQDQ